MRKTHSLGENNKVGRPPRMSLPRHQWRGTSIHHQRQHLYNRPPGRTTTHPRWTHQQHHPHQPNKAQRKPQNLAGGVLETGGRWRSHRKQPGTRHHRPSLHWWVWERLHWILRSNHQNNSQTPPRRMVRRHPHRTETGTWSLWSQMGFHFLNHSLHHRWELPGNYRDFRGVTVIYLFCRRTKRVLITLIIDFEIYILTQSLIIFIYENIPSH